MERELLTRLVTGAQQGDSQAMDQLFAEFYNDVYYFALKTVKDSDLACDITQETFLEIIRTIGDLQEPAAFITWLKQVTYHQCTRYFKKKKEVLVEEDAEGNTVFDTLADESEGSIPSEIYEKEEFRQTILEMINGLTEEQRSAVLLYYFDELPVAEIAHIQGVSENTVKSRLNYARKGLKKSVESYEKKHNIKLHSVAILPLLLLFFGREKMPKEKAGLVRGVVCKAFADTATSAAAGAAGAAGAGGASAATAGASAATAGGFAAKLAAMPLVAKIIAGIIAASVVVGGSVALINASGHTCEDTDRDCLCDACAEAVHHGGRDGTHYAFCEVCGAAARIPDEDQDHCCDLCGEYPCGTFHNQEHTWEDGVCVFCGRVENPHLDEDSDGYCNHCGEPMCTLMLAEHQFPDDSCQCSFCGFGEHQEGDVHPFCGVCRQRLPISDGDGDGACDTCGEYSCGGSHHGSSHADEDGDEKCDICQKYMCGLVWGLEHVFDYSDGIYDGKCDRCGGTGAAIGWGGDDRPHADANADGICDCCNTTVCDIYGMPEYGGVDQDGDGKCDICKYWMCDGHSMYHYHYDFDGDTKCDRCAHFICAHSFLPHVDENGDGRCDHCYSLI